MRERDPLELRREVSLVPQLPALIDGTVHDNVAYGPRLAGHSFDTRSCLELAGLDPAFEDRDSSKLSVGEQQRVMLARALALEPARHAAGRAHLGARPGGSRRGRGEPSGSARCATSISIVRCHP